MEDGSELACREGLLLCALQMGEWSPRMQEGIEEQRQSWQDCQQRGGGGSLSWLRKEDVEMWWPQLLEGEGRPQTGQTEELGS